MKATASPTLTKRSPMIGRFMYAKLAARWTGVIRVAARRPAATRKDSARKDHQECVAG
ncbi:MAG: hypothetical protein HY278_05635 [candidate division NC10 bacterium]|nr:hypothetical protein [candidate division NC10 bacterium]